MIRFTDKSWNQIATEVCCFGQKMIFVTKNFPWCAGVCHWPTYTSHCGCHRSRKRHWLSSSFRQILPTPGQAKVIGSVLACNQMSMRKTTETKPFEKIHQRSQGSIFHLRPAWMRGIIWGIIVLQELEATPASLGRGTTAHRCPFVCLKGSGINGRIFWGMALTSRSGTSINHVEARLLASLPVAFVSGAAIPDSMEACLSTLKCQSEPLLQPAADQWAVIGEVLWERYRRKTLISHGRLGPFSARPDGAVYRSFTENWRVEVS